jgi:hypothetical protein
MNVFDRLLRLYAARIVFVLGIVFAAVHTQNALGLANCGLVRLAFLAGPTCGLKFNASSYYEDGYEPSVAMNSAGLVVETHRDGYFNIWYTVGKIKGFTIDWGTPQKTGKGGYWPAVALGENGFVYLMYSDADIRRFSTQYYRVGKLDPKGTKGQLIDWRTDFFPVAGDGGFHASLSVMGSLLVGAYETAGGNDTCSYAIGTPNDPDHGDFRIHWYTSAGNKRTITDARCTNPHIAVAPGGRNNLGQILLVYSQTLSDSNGIVYERGSIEDAGDNEKQMYWETGPTKVTTDQYVDKPAIALLPNGCVIAIYHDALVDELRSTVGTMDLSNPSASIDWAPSKSLALLGSAGDSALTSNGTVAVETNGDVNPFTGFAYGSLFSNVASITVSLP